MKRAAVLFAALALSLIGAVAPVDGAVVGGTGGGGAPLPALQATPIASGLNFPVQMAMAPDRRIFFNERLTGKIRVLQRGAGSPPAYSLRSRPFYKLPVSTSGEQGLLGLAVDPEFPSQPFVYAYHTISFGGTVTNRVVRLRDVSGNGSDLTVILRRIPAASNHDGGILLFGGGRLFVSTGDASDPANAQNLGTTAGKVLRINRDGSIPTDNPFAGSPVWTYGHRNVFGLAWDRATSTVFNTENGPDRNDEINRLLRGRNYGWPIVTGVSGDPRFTDPLATYTPTIAPTDAAFYTGTRLPSGYVGGLFFGDFNTGSLRFVRFSSDRSSVVSQSVVIDFSPEIVLDVMRGYDGYLYVSTNATIYRITAAP